MARSKILTADVEGVIIKLADGVKPKRPRAKKTSLKDSIAAAVAQEEKTLELKHSDFHEVTLIKTGEVGRLFPWAAATACPWDPGYSRVIVPLKTPTKRGARVKTMIVRNSNIKHGRAA
jgi:hypothetical protein